MILSEQKEDYAKINAEIEKVSGYMADLQQKKLILMGRIQALEVPVKEEVDGVSGD